MNSIKLGLPKGSLNSKDRGNTHQIFVDAGYDIRGYEPGNESDRRLTIVNDPGIIPFLTRPQSAPVELNRQLLDIAIVGDDWVREESVSTDRNGIKKVGDLEYGQVRIVVAVPDKTDYESLSDFFKTLEGCGRPILCFTEYVNLTRQRFMQNEAYRRIFGNKKPLVQVRGLRDGENHLVQIINSDGVTEGYIAKGADVIVDNTQSGRTLDDYGLRELDQIMESSTGLYAGPSCIGWKERKAGEIFEQLKGAVIARNYFDVKFNVPNEAVERTMVYLMSRGLCSDEPTVSRGERFSAFNVLMPRGKFPEALRILRKDYCASAIVRNEVKQYIG